MTKESGHKHSEGVNTPSGIDMVKEEINMTKKYWIVFIIALIAILVAELAIYPEKRLGIAGIPFFHALIGFFSCFAIVFIAKIVGFFLKRKENYYKEVRHDG